MNDNYKIATTVGKYFKNHPTMTVEGWSNTKEYLEKPNLLQIDMKPSNLIVHLCKIVQQRGPINTKQSEKLAVKFDRLWGLA